MRKNLLLLLFLLFSNVLIAEELLTIRVPVRTGSAPFILQAHIFSKDPLAENIKIEVESDKFYYLSERSQQRLTELRIKLDRPGEHTLTVTVFGGPENKQLHKDSIGPIKVIGME